jgi:hypothetical protein
MAVNRAQEWKASRRVGTCSQRETRPTISLHYGGLQMAHGCGLLESPSNAGISSGTICLQRIAYSGLFGVVWQFIS